MNVWLTVPTRFDRDSLLPLLDACGVPHERCVVVVTRSLTGSPLPHEYRDCPVVQDTADPNIHRWWNLGIDYAVSHGGDAIIVVNDDVIAHEPLTKLTDALDVAGATLAMPTARGPITGWCFALNLEHNVRPDESFEWWYGDNDLWHRARRYNGKVGVIEVKVDVEHILRDYSALNKWQEKKVERDRALFASRYQVPSWLV